MLGMQFDLSALLGLGYEATALTFLQISLRGVIVFIATLAMLRLEGQSHAFVPLPVREGSATSPIGLL